MFAKRLANVSVSATLKVAAEAERLRREGYDVVDFSAGEPDFPTPEHVKAAGKAAEVLLLKVTDVKKLLG